MTIPRFHTLTGYSEDAVRSKIKRGEWLEDVIWVRAPDGRIHINMEAYERWVQGDKAVCAPHLNPPSRSTSTTGASAAASG